MQGVHENNNAQIGGSSSPNTKSQLVCNPNCNMEIIINNVVLLFSATNEETPYQQLLQYSVGSDRVM